MHQKSFAKSTTRSNCADNVQCLDSCGVTKCLAKHVVEVDEKARVFMSAPRDSSPTLIKITTEETGNTKISSVKALEQKRLSEEKRKVVGRLVTEPEALMLPFGIASIVPTLNLFMSQLFLWKNAVHFNERRQSPN